MRKISYLFALLVSFIAFNACTSDVDNYFPESAPERASKTVAEVKKTLQEASNGWRMEYYVMSSMVATMYSASSRVTRF